MDKAEAIKIQKTIEALCRDCGVWVESTHENKPDLKCIRLAISIKVTPKR